MVRPKLLIHSLESFQSEACVKMLGIADEIAKSF